MLPFRGVFLPFPPAEGTGCEGVSGCVSTLTKVGRPGREKA